MIDFIGLRRVFFFISLLVLTPCLLALAIWQLNPGIDFVGGLEIEVRFQREISAEEIEPVFINAEIPGAVVSATNDGTFRLETPTASLEEGQEFVRQIGATLASEFSPFILTEFTADDERVTAEFWLPADVSPEDVRSALASIDLGDARVQATGESSFKIRVQQPDDGTPESLRQPIEDALSASGAVLFTLQSSSVSGILSAEIAKDAAIALGVAALAIMIYISLAFRRLPNPLLYGVAAIVALLHDVTVVVGVFAILGQTVDMEVNAMFITALLAIIGYSVNDTIVIFDRIRENFLGDPSAPLRRVVNAAITQSLGRSLNTSITLILALLALALIGGVTVRPFVVVLMVGAIVGTYSSIAVASQIVVLWEERTLHRLFRVGGRDDAAERERARRARVSA